jgi:hypothetical protein
VLFRLCLLSLAFAHPGVVGTAAAHPEAAALGLKTRMSLHPDHVELLLLVEIPSARLAIEAKEEGFPEKKLQELRDSLWLRLDGERLSLTAVPVEHPVRESAEPGMAEIEVRVSGPLPKADGDLSLEVGAYPTDNALVATAVDVDGSRVIPQTTLVEQKDGELRNNRNGQWLRDEDARRTILSFRPAGVLERGQGLFPIGERLEGRAKLQLPPIVWVGGVIIAVAWVLFRKKS